MALLYSRPRIKIPKVYLFRHQNSHKNKKVNQLFMLLIYLIVLLLIILKMVSPIFNKLCLEKAKSLATIICNRQTTKCLQGYSYSDFVTIHTDDNKNIKMLEANMININMVISDITEKIQVEIDNTENDDIYISTGSFTGVSLLSGRGPKIPIRITTVGNVITDFKSEFIEKGVNQTLHRLYLEIECEISILTPFNTIQEKINNQFIIAENVIVGNIPSSYYNLEGLNKEDTLEIIQ